MNDLDHASGLQALADRHGVSLDAVRHLLHALERGNGTMAQFDHPDFGGMGQWSAGGMIMVGRMFDDALKARVGALCNDLASSLPAGGWASGGASPGGWQGGWQSGGWWPEGLGSPSSSGSQNGLRYAYFPATRRLAIDSGQGVALYDTGDHHVSGVSQSNGSLSFTGSQGTIALDSLRRVDGPAEAFPPPPPPVAPPPSFPAPFQGEAPGGDVLATIERLAALHARGVLTEREFADKKAELLGRL